MFLILDFVTSTNVDNHTHLKGMQKQKKHLQAKTNIQKYARKCNFSDHSDR